MKKRIAGLLLLSLAACDALPRDPDRTSDRLRQSRILRVGINGEPVAPQAQSLVAELAEHNDARVSIRRAALEPLIVDLNAGRLDLILAPMAKDSPWKKLVAPGPALSVEGAGKQRLEWRALMKNGENRWIMQVERLSRQVSGARS